MKPLSRTLLAASLSLAFAGGAAASEATPAGERELAAARAELDRAAKRYAELAGQHRGHARDIEARMSGLRNRAVLGVLLAEDEQAGVRITGVTPDSGAAKAGLRSGDRLVSVDGKEVLGSTGALRVENTRTLLGGLEAGKPVRIGYVRDGRRATTSVTPSADRRFAVFTTRDGARGRADGNVVVHTFPDGALSIDADAIDVENLAAIAPEVRRDIRRVVDGQAPRLLSAFRWNGLNLASVDPQLGRYFGAERGVLVLSNGELAGLQAGDVIQRVDGKAVSTPREVMDVLRDKGDGERVAVDYLRDRRSAQARMAIPKAMAWPPAPPAPPAPPSPPAATPKAPAAPPAPATPRTPPSPPAPPSPPRTVSIDVDGDTITVVDVRSVPGGEGNATVESETYSWTSR